MASPKTKQRRARRRLKRQGIDLQLRARDKETAKRGPGARLGVLAVNAFVPKWIRRSIQRSRRKRALEERTGHMQRFSAAAYGNPIPLAFGRVMIEPTVIYASDFATGAGDNIVPTAIAPANPEGEDVELYITLALGVCVGPVGAVTRIWAEDTLIYNITASAGYSSSYADFSTKISVYLGDETQTADPFLEELEGTGNVPAYRGLCYLVLHGFPLKRFGNQVPRFRVEVSGGVSLTYPTETRTLAGLGADGLLLSRARPLLYAWDSSTTMLSALSRNDFSLTFQRDMSDLFNAVDPGGATPTSTFVLDEGSFGDDLFFFALSSGGGSFFLRFRPLLGTFDSNIADALVGATEVEGIGIGEFFVTADATGARLRGYRKTKSASAPFVRLWERAGPDASAIPGNFTYDDQGRAWLISYTAGAPATGVGSVFFLSRISTDGQVTHFTVSNRGRCKQVAFSNLPFSGDRYLLCGGGDSGTLLRMLDDGTFSAQLASVTADNQRGLFLSQQRFGAERFLVTDGDSLFRVNTRTMTTVQEIEAPDHGLRVVGIAYDPERDTVYSAEDVPGGGLVACQLDRRSDDVLALSTVISDLCVRAGLELSEIDVSALSSTGVDGYAMREVGSADEAIEELADVYLFGTVQSGAGLVFSPLRISGATAIPASHLGSSSDGGEPEPYTYTILGPDQVPARVTVVYPDRDRDYAEVEQYDKRLAELWPGTGEVEIHTSVVLTATAARQLAQNLVHSGQRERIQYDLALPPQYLKTDPNDVFSLTLLDGTTETVRVDGLELGADLFLRVNALRAEAASYDAVVPGAGADASTAVLETDAPTAAVVLDIPVLRGLDDRSGVYVAVAPLGAGRWEGARVSLRTEDAVTPPGVVVLEQSPIGFVADALPTSTAAAFESGANLSLQLLAGSLTSATEEELYTDALRNLLAVGTPARGWELLQFATASDVGGGQWTLSGLLRGRFGTEHQTGTHGEGETVVALDPTTLGRLSVGEGRFGDTLRYRAVTLTSPDLLAVESVQTYRAECLTPFSPVALSGVRGAGPRDYDLFWARRPRVGGTEWADTFDAPVGEAVESYEVEILSGPSGTVLRTLSVTMPPEIIAVNLSVASGDQSVSRASGSFVTDGWRPGQVVELRGFSNADNNGFFQVVTVAALKLTLTGGAASVVTEASASGRRLRAASAVAVWTEAQQTTDTGALAGSATFRVYQMSDVVGRGHVSAELTVT